MRLFRCSVILYQTPVLYFLLDVRIRAPEPRSKVRRTRPSTSSMDRKSLCKKQAVVVLRWSGGSKCYSGVRVLLGCSLGVLSGCLTVLLEARYSSNPPGDSVLNSSTTEVEVALRDFWTNENPDPSKWKDVSSTWGLR